MGRRKEDFSSNPIISTELKSIAGVPQSNVLFSDTELYKQYLFIVMNGIESLPCVRNVELSPAVVEDFFGYLMAESHFTSAKK
jgi:hypothetical protein